MIPFSLSSIANALIVVADALPAAVTAASDIYKFGAAMIVAAENAYSSTTGSGATKKAAVMASIQAFVEALGQNFSAIEKQISAWIDMVIAAYRSAAAALSNTNAALPTAAQVTAAAASAQAAAGLVGSSFAGAQGS